MLVVRILISRLTDVTIFIVQSSLNHLHLPIMYTPEDFSRQVKLTYDYVEAGHSKSPNRLFILQRHIAALSQIYLPELTVEAPNLQDIGGHFHQKQFPIVIRRQGDPICCIGTTLTLKSYASNIYNYFQEITGEAVNIQLDHIHYCSIWVIPTRVPKTRRNGTTYYQTVTEQHFRKFFRLMRTEGAFRPYALGCFVVDINYETDVITPADLTTIFTVNNIQNFRDNLSMEQFFEKIRALD